VSDRVATDPRISRRRRAIERTRRRRAFGWLGTCAAAALVAYGAFFSPLLDVRGVDVVGTKNVAVSEVEGAADVDGDNLLLLSTDAVRERIEELPWVATAKVDRRLPGTVRIKIEERSAAVALDLASGRWIVDAKGHILERGGSPALPAIAGLHMDGLTPGERVASSEALAALSVWRSLRGIQNDVQAIFAPTTERISLSLTGGTTVRYGAAEGLRAKRAVLRVLLARIRADGTIPEYVDVRVPANPAVGPPLTAPVTAATPTGTTPTPAPTATADA
jgi:cell division protein FtsQ